MNAIRRLHRPIHGMFIASCLGSSVLMFQVGDSHTVYAGQQPQRSEQAELGSQSARIDALKDRQDAMDKHLESNDTRLDALTEKSGAVTTAGGTAMAIIGVLAALGFLGRPGRRAEVATKEVG